MIHLYQPPSAWGLPSMSPFCVKLEAYLRLTGQDYKVRGARPDKGPKGKVPFIEDGAVRMGDSQLIIEYLKGKGNDPDARLTPAEQAQGHTLRRMLEESTYWALVYQRWADPQGAPLMQACIRQLLPAPLKFFLIPLIMRRTKNILWAQGTGRHTTEEIYALASADLTAASVLLGDQPYLFGEEPTSFDCVLYAFVGGISNFPAFSTLKSHALTLTNLQEHHQRFHERVFAGWKPVKSLT